MRVIQYYQKIGLVPLIIIGLIIGVMIGLLGADSALVGTASILGTLFVGALKGIAPVLVFFLVISAIATQKTDARADVKPVLIMYLAGTFLAALTAVVFSMIFPTTLILTATDLANDAPKGLYQVLTTLLSNLVQNPISAIGGGNYLGILFWAVLFGMALRTSSDGIKAMLGALSDAITRVVGQVIWFAPFGILGIVAQTVGQTGVSALLDYGRLLAVLVGAMAFIALIINPLMVFVKIKKNPYPLVLTCLKQSGMTAFFTRSSAANIPVNLNLAKNLGLNADTYSVSIPLGATINMAGAAITINVMTLAAAHTLGISVGFLQALLLSIIATLSAAGASGVAGGSLLLIPLACNLLNIPDDIAMQVVAIGFIIGVVQDSVETALNSSTDVLFTAACDPIYQGARDGS